jgi:hypothetical protein
MKNKEAVPVRNTECWDAGVRLLTRRRADVMAGQASKATVCEFTSLELSAAGWAGLESPGKTPTTAVGVVAGQGA